MRDKEGFTPRERAYEIATGWIRRVHSDGTGDIPDDVSPTYERELKRQLAKIHNRLLVQSGLDGLPLEV